MAGKISKKDFVGLIGMATRIIHQNETRRTHVQMRNTIRDLKELASYVNSNSTLEQELSEKISGSLNDIIPSIRSLDDIGTLGSLYNILLRWPIIKIESNQLRESDTYTVMQPRKDVDTGEWVVVVKKNGKRDEDKTYYAADKEDAIGTRKLMLKELGLSEAYSTNFQNEAVKRNDIDTKSLDFAYRATKSTLLNGKNRSKISKDGVLAIDKAIVVLDDFVQYIIDGNSISDEQVYDVTYMLDKVNHYLTSTGTAVVNNFIHMISSFLFKKDESTRSTMIIDERRHKKNQLTGKKLTQNLIFQLNGRIAGVAANLNGLIKTIEDLQTQDLEGLDSLQAGLSRVVAQLNTASQTFDGNSGTKSKIAELVDDVRKW